MKAGDIIQSKEKVEVKAKVNWVVNGEAGISYTEPEDHKGGGNNIRCEEWIVIFDFPLPPQTLQSKAENMSIEELRANIESLRALRARPLKQREARESRGSPSDPLALALASLSPEQLAKIKEKLGLKTTTT